MASNAYMQGRKKYGRPQAMLWADNPGAWDAESESYVPVGNEIGSDGYFSENGQFIIISDDNRQPIDFKPQRIEKRERMANGRMRSYHIADKLSVSTSWQMLPSRSHYLDPEFISNPAYTEAIGKSIYDAKYLDGTTLNPQRNKAGIYTSDGGAGGVEMLDWYNNHPGSFFLFLSYDNYKNFSQEGSASPYENLPKYSEIVEVFFSDFSYSIEKRAGSTYDFWTVSVSLEEV